jgi:hypothetical protein
MKIKIKILLKKLPAISDIYPNTLKTNQNESYIKHISSENHKRFFQIISMMKTKNSRILSLVQIKPR